MNKANTIKMLAAAFAALAFTGFGAVEIRLSAYDGIYAYVADVDADGYEPYDFVTVSFVAGEKAPSRASAVYQVQPDGSLLFAEDGEEPRGLAYEAMNDSTWQRYTSLSKAVAEASAGDTVVVTADSILAEDLVLDGSCTLDVCGHYIDPDMDNGSNQRLVVNAAALVNGSYYSYAWINAEVVANVSLDLAAERISVWMLSLGRPGVSVVAAAQIWYVTSPSEQYIVDEAVRDDGCYVYTLVENPAFILPPMVAVPKFAGGTSTPVQEKISAWADDNYVDTETVSEAAFLLDCAEDEVAAKTAEFKIVSISEVAGNWVVKVTGGKGDGEAYGNGYIRIRQVDLPGAASNGDTRAFFRAELVADASAE